MASGLVSFRDLLPATRLTPRELEVARRLAAGATNREIAAALGIREQSVKNVLHVVFRKLGVRNRVELSVYVMRHGLLERKK